MAIGLAWRDLIVLVARVGRVWPAGFAAVWHEHGWQPRLWQHGRLLRDGALHLAQHQQQLGWWQRRGIGLSAAGVQAQDRCGVGSQRGVISRPCDRLEPDMAHARARLRR